MKFIKTFESFDSIQGLKIGDMVYVDTYGPSTHRYSNGSWDVKRDKPFRPKLYDFTSNVKYEIVYIEGSKVTLYDNKNNAIDLSIDRVDKDKPFTDKDGLIEMD